MASKVQKHLSYLLMGKTLKEVKLVDGLCKHNVSWVYVHQRKLRLVQERTS